MDSLVSTNGSLGTSADRISWWSTASWHMPASIARARRISLRAHPSARFLDIDEVSDKQNPAPHMLPPAGEFAAAMERLGIGSNDRIVVYDNSPIHTAARGWFMLRHFGAREVAILDGGFQKWLAEGRPTESGEPTPRETRFEARENCGEVVTKHELLNGMPGMLVDARGRARFEGSEADPRPGVAAGHIPGARNLPFATLYNEDGTFKSPEEIERLFAEAGGGAHAAVRCQLRLGRHRQ